MIRPAAAADLPAVSAICEAIHDREEAGPVCTSWQRGQYSTVNTARQALDAWENNVPAMYPSLGYRFAGATEFFFQGFIPRSSTAAKNRFDRPPFRWRRLKVLFWPGGSPQGPRQQPQRPCRFLRQYFGLSLKNHPHTPGKNDTADAMRRLLCRFHRMGMPLPPGAGLGGSKKQERHECTAPVFSRFKFPKGRGTCGVVLS